MYRQILLDKQFKSLNKYSDFFMSKIPLDECVRNNLESYFKDLEGIEPDNMYDMFVSVVEKPLLEVVMKYADNNQSRASLWLGLNRNTLHKKLLEHKMIK